MVGGREALDFCHMLCQYLAGLLNSDKVMRLQRNEVEGQKERMTDISDKLQKTRTLNRDGIKA